MPLTPSNRPGRLTEDLEIKIEAQPSDPGDIGVIRFNGTAFRLRDSAGVFDPRTGGTVDIGNDTDLLLVTEPPEPTTDYAIARTGGLVDSETWTRSGGNKLKDVVYARTGGLVDQEDRKVYATNGTTVLGHLRIVYTRTGGLVTSAVYTRVV